LSKEGWQRRGARYGELEKKMTFFFVFVDIQFSISTLFMLLSFGILKYLVLDYCSGGMAPFPDLVLVIICLAGLWLVM